MKKLILFVFILINFNNVLSQWIELPSNPNRDYNGVDFINENTGWMCADFYLYKSTNGGINWIIQASYYPEIVNPIDIQFTDINHGIAAGEYGIILRTTNSGSNWILQYFEDSTIYFQDLCFINNNTGWLVGSDVILKTTNGGVNWLTQLHNEWIGYNSVKFINEMTGWVTGGGYGNIVKTTNGGQNWFTIHIGTSYYYYRLFFISATTGWISGEVNSFHKTTNGGLNWMTQNIGPDGCSYIYFVNVETGWIGVSYYGKLLKTTNGGNNWTLQYPGTYEKVIESIDFISPVIGWAVGRYGRILKTTNGGSIVGFSSNNEEYPNTFSLSQNYPNPFNPSTTIKFDIPKSLHVLIVVYDLLGREVEELLNEEKKAGSYEVGWDGSGFASGIYFYKIITDEFTETKKMVLMK